MSIKINEIYFSIQGESTHSGRPCIFVRLTYCNLRCTYCDTEHAFYEGKDMDIPTIIEEIKKWNCNLIEVTGGEPLFQSGCIELLNELNTLGYEILLETGGSISIAKVPKNVIKIIDFKCPSSGMQKKNLWSIVNDIQIHDEIKFVIGNRDDYNWAKKKIYDLHLNNKCTILMSPSFEVIDPSKLVSWILNDNLPVRMQMQMHKFIWKSDEKGV